MFSQQMKLVQQMKQQRETSKSQRTADGILENSQEQSSKSAVTDCGGANMVRVLKPPSKYNATTGTPSKYQAKNDSQKILSYAVLFRPLPSLLLRTSW